MNTKLRKLFLRMSKIAICVTICIYSIFMTFASGVSAQNKYLRDIDVSIVSGEGDLIDVLSRIENSSDFSFVYFKKEIRNKAVTLDKNKWRMDELLKEISTQAMVSFSRINETITVTKAETNDQLPVLKESLAEQQSIRGTVTDEDGAGLPGATILEKGTSNGTITDVDGKFSLSVSEDAVLTVSFVGYQSIEVPLNGRSVIDIELTSDISSLEEVVVVGYGTQKKSDVTGSVASVSEETLQSRPVATFEDALQGRTSGVQVRQSGGDLNGKFSISIRGVGSVTGSNDPLIVVDGVPLFSTDFSTINPKDIASIDILKDASATAIYGARAANGVVIVTTKKGRAGETQFTFSTDLGFEEITKTFDVMSTEEQRQLFVEAFTNSNRNTSVYDDPNDPAWQVDTDWQDLGTRTGFRQNYNLGFSGGSEKTQYSGSVSYLNREGTLLNSDLQSYTLRVNVSSQLKDWAKLSTNLTASYQAQNVQNNDSWGSAGFRSLSYQHSYTPAYDENGELTAVNTTAAPYFGANGNPLIDILLPTRERDVTRALGNTKLDINLTDDLVLSGNLGADVVIGDDYTYAPVYEIGRYNRPIGSVTSRIDRQINWVSDLTLNYSKQFGAHSIIALAGISAQQFLTRVTNVTGTGTIDNGLNQLSNQTDFNASGSEVTAGLVSSFFRLNYDFDNKYLITGTVRRDGSSKFGPEKRYGVFPSGSIAWRISEEGILQSSSLVDDLKLRMSYGLTGNQNIGDFAFITRSGAASYVFGNSIVVGNAPQNIGNPNLQWETTKQFNVGIDLSLYEGRINTTLDYYNKESVDLLVSTPIPLTSGVNQDPIVNLGSVRNRGVEFSIFSRNLVKEFKWTTNFNISYNENEVLDIGTNSIGEPLEIPGEVIPLGGQPANLTKAGHPVGAFYMYQFEGVWQLGEEAAAQTWSNAVPGDPKYVDRNGNGLFDAGDKDFVGNPFPKFFGGMDNTFSYNNLSLSIFVNFATGYQLYNTARNLLARGVPFVQNFAEVNGFWTQENPSNTVPRPSQGGNTTSLVTLSSTRWLEDADFLRVKNVKLMYNFPSTMFGDSFINGAQVSISATNLFTFTNYSGLDPEASSRTSLLSAGLDYTPYPLTRLFSLGAQINF